MSADRPQRPQSPRRGPEPPLRPRLDGPRGRIHDHDLDDHELDAPRKPARSSAGRARGQEASSSPGRGGRIRGAVAVLGMFLVTLAGAAIDSFVGVGLGLVTLVTMVGVTAVATLVVRRRDLVSVVVAPPLVFIAVAAVNIAAAPSASFSLPTIATLLVRGFPTMGIATAVALVLAVVRLIARR